MSIRKYAISTAIVGAATLIQWLVWPIVNPAPYVLYYPAVLLVSLWGAGVYGIWLCVLCVELFFVPHLHGSGPTVLSDIVRHCLFIVSAYMVRYITVRLQASLSESRQALARLRESEARFRSVMQSSLDGVLVLDAQDRVVHWNSQAERLFGLSPADSGRRLASELLVLSPAGDQSEEGPWHLLTSGEALPLQRRLEVRARRSAGAYFPAEVSAMPISADTSATIAVFVRDLSAEKRTARDLQLRSDVMENSLNGIDIVNERGLFLYANRAYLDMWGYSSLAEIQGTSATSHCADPEQARRIITTLKEKGEYNDEFLARRKDGSTFLVHMWARLAHDAEGNEIYPSTSVDVTERRKAEEALRTAVRTRDEFISICSHELKTPVTSMKLQFQTAERQLNRQEASVYSEAAVRRRTQNSLRQLDRMGKLIEDMLDVSRLSTGRLRFEFRPLRLADLAQESVQRLEEDFAKAGTPLSLEIKAPNARVNGDTVRLEQVLSNLLTNSLKYGAGSPVRMEVSEEGAVARVTVSDGGKGIATADLDRIFRRFERSDAHLNMAGLGLGLFICRQIVEAHEGRVWAESPGAKGAKFTVELPTVAAPEAPERGQAPE